MSLSFLKKSNKLTEVAQPQTPQNPAKPGADLYPATTPKTLPPSLKKKVPSIKQDFAVSVVEPPPSVYLIFLERTVTYLWFVPANE
ncbi:hypothetical protein KKE68_00835 [Patescibacteria group bacterium]|nr:hypothetical protein [Patescibacteria group bacterium]